MRIGRSKSAMWTPWGVRAGRTALALLVGAAALAGCGTGSGGGGTAADTAAADPDTSTADPDALTADTLVADTGAGADSIGADSADDATPPDATSDDDATVVADAVGSDATTPDDEVTATDLCATDTGTIVAKTIGPEGGVLQLGPAVVQIPPGALGEPTLVTLDQTAETAPMGVRTLSAIYELGPWGLVLSTPAKLTVTLAELPPTPGDVALHLGPLNGPYNELTTTLTGNNFSADVPGPGYGFAAWKTPSGLPPTLACTPKGEVTTLFDNFANGNSYHVLHARRAGSEFALTTAYQQDGLFTGRVHRFGADGAQLGSINLFPNNFTALYGAHTSVGPDGNLLYAYDANPVGGLDVWVGRISPSGTIVTPPVNVTKDNLLGQQPRVVPLGPGAFVVWMAWDELAAKRWLKGAFLDADLKVVSVLDISQPLANTAPGTFSVVSDGAVAGVAWSYGGSSGNGARYQAFAGGCAITPVIPVAAKLVTTSSLSAALSGQQVAIAYAASNDNFRIRIVDLHTGLLGPVRTFGPLLSHPGIAPYDGGWLVAGIKANSPKSDVSVLRLNTWLDVLASQTPVGQVSGYSMPTSIATDATGSEVLVGWTSTGIDTVGGGGNKIQGLVQVLQCP